MADSFYVSGLSGKSGARSGGVFTPGGTGSMTSGDDYSRSGTEFYPVVTPNDGDDGSAIDNLNTRGTEAPAGSAIQPSINDSVAVELMLEDKEVIIDTRGRVELPDIDDLDFINSSVKPNPYAYATSYYTTFYVRNYSYNWNDNSYLSVDINGKVTDIYANSYGTVRMDYYPTDTEITNSICSLKFIVNTQNTNKYKTLEPGNYIVWENCTSPRIANQPYYKTGLLYLDEPATNNLLYATVSKNARIIVDSDVSNADISAIQKWWTSAYFTYVANIWQKWSTNNGVELVTYANNAYAAIQDASILLNNIPDTSNKFFLICGNFGVGDEIIRYATTFIITPNLSSNNPLEWAGTITFEDTSIRSTQTIKFEEGKLVTINITPNTNYKLDANGSSFKRNGSTFTAEQEGESITYNEENYSVTFRVTASAVYETIFDKRTYHITVNTTSGGIAIGTGNYQYNDNISIMAIPNNGYHFAYWDDGHNDNNDNIQDNPYSFNVIDNATYTAHFAQNEQDEYTISVSCGGTYGTSTVTITPSDHVVANTEVTITPNAAEGYRFVRWEGNYTGTNSPARIIITGPMTIIAIFEQTHTVSASVNPIDGGTVTINGSIPDGNYICGHGSNVVLDATPGDNYIFGTWSGDASGTNNQYTISNITSNKIVVANFIRQYVITVNSNDDTMGTVSGGGTVNAGGSITIYATPNTDYCFVSWNDGNTDRTRILTDIRENATYTATFAAIEAEEEEWPGDEYFDNEEEDENEVTTTPPPPLLNNTDEAFINYIKPRVAIVSGSQLERIHGEFLPIFCLPNNYGSMPASELSEMYNNSTYMICDTAGTTNTDGTTAFCNVVKSVNNISINLCDNYEEYCTYKYNDGENRYVILDGDINSLHSYTYNYVTTAFQATGDPNTICHTAAYINIYDNVVTQEFRNDGKYSIIDAMSRKNSTYMMYVSLNIDPYYEAKVIGGKNMTYTPLSLFKSSNYNRLQDNSNVTLFHSENMPSVDGLTNGIFNETSKRGAFVFMIDEEGETNINTDYNPSSFVDNTNIILSSGAFFDRNNNIIANADKKTFIESIILANPMCTISYTNTDKIKTAYFVNGDEYTTELLWHTPISEVSVELYPSYIVNHGNISNITYKFTDKYSNNDSDIYIIPNVNTNINKNNDIYTIAFSDANILNNLDINFDNTIEEKKYKVCNTVLVGENQNVIECTYNTVTLIADVPSKTPITASVIVKQEIPKFKLNNDWPQEPTP